MRAILGPADFGTIGRGQLSSYKEISEGENTIGDLFGNISVTGKGKHQWKLTINSNGTLSIAEDK